MNTRDPAVEAYVERAAALGIDPVEARAEAERMKALLAPTPTPTAPRRPSPLADLILGKRVSK